MSETKKKILYLITQSEWGGAQKYIYYLAVNRPQDFEVVIAAGEGNDLFLSRLANKEIRTIKLRHVIRRIKPIEEILAIKELIKLFQQELPDFIHLNSSKLSILGSLANLFARYPKNKKPYLVYTAHGWVFNEPLFWLIKRLYLTLEKFTARFKNKIITVSRFDYSTALTKKITDQSKLICIYNQIDPKEEIFLNREEARKELNQLLLNKFIFSENLNDFKIVGTIANLYATKGLDFLIKAAVQVTNSLPKTIFLVIGDGPRKEYLNREIFKNNLKKKFILVGSIREASKLIKAFDLFVLPSVKEGLPYTILEAKLARIPVVATEVGGVPEILAGEFLVEPKQPEKLANKIVHYLTHPTQPASTNDPQKLFQDFLEKTYSLYVDESRRSRLD